MNPRLASIALAVLLLVSPLLVSPMAASTGALLLEGDGPWRNSRWQLGVSEFRSLLEEAGYQVRIISPADLAKQVSGTAGRVAIAVPSLERLPISAFRAIAGRIQRGDILLASGGEAFREPLYRAPGGKWVALEELLSQAPRTPLLEPGRARLRSPSRPPEGVVTRKRIPGPDGKLDSLELRINQPVRLALEESEPFTQSPFATGQSTTIVTVKGTAEEMLAVEWREADGTRWRARVPLTPGWRTHILRPSNFELPPNASPGGDKKRFDPSRVRVFAFGPAGEVNTPASGSVEYAIGPVTLGSNPQAEDFEIPHIETISPWYKQYESVRAGERVLVPIARPRGLTAAPEPDGRYEAIGNLLDPAATRYLTSTGAAVFWLPWPQLSGKHRGELVELLRRTSHGLALLNGGAGVFAVDPGRRVDLGARVYNASPRAVTANLTWAVLRGDQQLLARSAAARIPAGQMRDVSVGGAADLPPGEYRVETVVRAGKAVCDQGNGYLRVTDPSARTAGERLRVRDGHFFAGEKQVFLNGVNYWPRNVAGLEPARYWDHWLTPRNYDPESVEADLAALEALG
ncbi:MAG TPA: hypothetical protein VHA11_13205, partial [Bryobacteraceae bacterium]|nr:hypothetical protein [Bryobacteraceae bacterium]